MGIGCNTKQQKAQELMLLGNDMFIQRTGGRRRKTHRNMYSYKY